MENKQFESPAAWRPEPGKTAWTIKLSGVIEEVMINSYKHTQAGYKVTYTAHGPITGVVINKDGILNFFPTAEAALASIKIYDLNGVEVPRQQPVISVHDEFLDPSPRLEPTELHWVSNALGEWAYHGDWTFRAGYDGTWYANYKDRYVDGIGTMHERETSVETAKSAIHEWRVNHLKSMTA